MPRLPSPYVEYGWYISRPGGEYVRLCPQSEGKNRAKEVLREHLNKRRVEQEQNDGRPVARVTVSELFVMFLEAVEAEKSPHTYADYQRWCIEFARLHGKRQARDLTRLDAQKFKQHLLGSTWVRNKQAPQPYRPKTINHAIIALRRAFNWAIDNEVLPPGRNPFARLKLLSWQGRKRVATPDEFAALLAHCTDDHFRDVLIAMRFTPVRPGDIRNLTWSMVDWERHRWLIWEHKTTNTARTPRAFIVGMNEDVEEMLKRRAEKFGQEGRVFLNERGKPWTRNALGLRMRRLRKRAGVAADDRGEEFVLYTNRHTFITASGLVESIPEAVRTDMAGHTDGRTTRLYTHIHDEAVTDAGRRVANMLRLHPTPGK